MKPHVQRQVDLVVGSAARVRMCRCLAASAFVLLAGACLVGCVDRRISLDALQELEEQTAQEVAQQTEVEVEPAELALTELQPYKVGPRDVLSLTLHGATEPYSANVFSVRVHNDGTVRLPLVGEVNVGGLDLVEVEKAVIDAHVPDFVKQLSVFAELVGPEQTTVLVTGAAGQPGLVSLRSNERSILYALALSGGFLPGASGQVRVQPVRPDRDEVAYDLRRPNDVRRAMLAPPLESGDTVVVEAAPTSAVYLTGLVNLPGPLAVPPDSTISAVRAVASAGGLVDFLGPKEATLWRELPDGKNVRAKVEIAKVLSGELPDFDLRPGDILDVPHTAETRFRDWILQNIRIGPFSFGAAYDPVAEWRFRRALDEQERGFGRSAIDNVLYSLPNVIVPPVLPPSQ